ncbi:MAG: SoxR reducing system RseC family protein [Candidatus Limivicinus sp.]|nr:SoxR reducing system RseC family protein [Clostridiales bacterium]MDY3860276.1 SoxR reducing system RseC family protein [Candidatus Limivicinus sp.]
MTQDAIVTKCLPNGMAEVVVTRTTACGSNCGNCESCIFQSELKTLARNQVDAKPGQRVVIESKSSKIYGAAMLVYILPIVLVVFGYAVAYAAGAGEGVCVASSFAGLLIGAAIIVMSQRLGKNKKPITFDIVQLN